jgi:hypothetical protein
MVLHEADLTNNEGLFVRPANTLFTQIVSLSFRSNGEGKEETHFSTTRRDRNPKNTDQEAERPGATKTKLPNDRPGPPGNVRQCKGHFRRCPFLLVAKNPACLPTKGRQGGACRNAPLRGESTGGESILVG